VPLLMPMPIKHWGSALEGEEEEEDEEEGDLFILTFAKVSDLIHLL
jgi:hypothetical protein